MIQIMTYKQLIKLISEAETNEDVEKAWWNIDRAFEHEKITWNDHEILYTIASKLYK